MKIEKVLRTEVEHANECISYFESIIPKKLWNYKCWLAGGCIRSFYTRENIMDVDLYFMREDDRISAINDLLKMDGRILNETKYMTKLAHNRMVYDFVKIVGQSERYTISKFDFTVNMAALNKDAVFHHSDFFVHNAMKRLKLNLDYELGDFKTFDVLMGRFQKFVKKGYTMPGNELDYFQKIIK